MPNASTNRRILSGKAKLAAVALSLSLLVPLAAKRLCAEDRSKDLSGTVYDASGAGVPGATVTLADQAGKLVAVTQSEAAGRFSFNGLLAGEYEMHATKPGFEPYTVSHISLPCSACTSRVITLRVAALTEEMDVVAQKPQTSAKPVSPNRVHLGGDLEAAKPLNRLKPVCPPEAMTAGIEGTVLLHAVIGMDGNPLSLEVINSADPQLARCSRGGSPVALSSYASEWLSNRGGYDHKRKLQALVLAECPATVARMVRGR